MPNPKSQNPSPKHPASILPASVWLAALLTLITIQASAQTFSDSNLPIVIINTQGDICDAIRTPGNMKVIWRGNGMRNFITDKDSARFLNFIGRIDIEIRGSSSQYMPKKQYGFTTRKADGITADNVSLLGMPPENDWILNGMVYDPAYIRDYLCYNLSRRIGEYASRTVYCELVINGDFKGLYLLQEKIKAERNRVDILKIHPYDNAFPDITGGYITKADKTTGGDPIAWTMHAGNGEVVNYVHDFPDPDKITRQQHDYIYRQFLNLDQLADNSSVINGYPSLIDIPSFIHFMIITELASNADSYSLSTYFHKDRNGKLRAGPIWDNDLTFGNDLFGWGYDRSKSNVWQFDNNGNLGSSFWNELFHNALFRCYFSKRWNEVTSPGKPLNKEKLDSFIDETVSYITEAVHRDKELWGDPSDYMSYISAIKSFIGNRINWIDSHIGPYRQCSGTAVPPLVISGIMYHPRASVLFPQTEEMEFIEISNIGIETIDVSGYYFRGTGLIYQFPAHALIDSGETVILAANAGVYHERYGKMPFGVFSRHLSDSAQDLILSDAFGNVIDSVRYNHKSPWPDANGNGSYLKLGDLCCDNCMASNWMACKENIILASEDRLATTLVVYPNPVHDKVMIRNTLGTGSISIADSRGSLMLLCPVSGNHQEIDLSSFPPGSYVIRIVTGNLTYIRKIMKL